MPVNNAVGRAALVFTLALASAVLGGLPADASGLVAHSAAQTASTARLQPGPQPTTPKQPNLPRLDDEFGATAIQKQAMTAAAAAARSGKKPVVVGGLTTETQLVTAQPDGRVTLSANPQPVRTPQRETWVPVDTTLHRNTNGTLSPAATAYGTVTFSDGGTTPVATTTSGATTYAVSWPTPLPAPTVSGTTATYANVLPGVDLQVSATVAGGFADVLVVHTAQAARNPALATLTLAQTVGGGHVAAGPHGGITVQGAPGDDTLDAATPLMWDSNTAPATPPGGKAPQTPAGVAVVPDPSDATHPGLAAHLGIVHTTVHGSSMDLTPDPHLLTGSTTVFPIYVDPTFNWHPTNGGTPAFDEVKQGAPCTNTSFFDNAGSAGDNGNLGVGYNNWTSCFGVMRAYYQWQLPQVIWGAHIGPGTSVNLAKTYSAACVNSTDSLHWSGAIGPGTSWNNQPSLGGPIGTNTNVGHTGGCPGFGSTVPLGFDVTGQIAASAASHSTQFTVALTGNEARGNVEFSRFSDNPTLNINYNLIPNTPGSTQMAAVSGSDNAGCATSPPYPYMGKTIATNTPVLDAGVSDPDGDNLQASYQYWVDGSSTPTGANSADNLPSGSTAAISLPTSFVSGLTNGQVVDWQVRVSDGEDWSGWSPVCHFIAEPNAPSAPTITSADGRYPNNGTKGATVGTPGQFTLSSTGGQVSTLVDGLDQPPPTSGVPAGDTVPFGPGGVVTPADRWTLTDGTGTTATDSIAGHTATLSPTGTTWTTTTSRGTALSLDGIAGDAATTGPVVNTSGSFTVSAWADLMSLNGWASVAAQIGNHDSGFYLQYSLADNKWAFSRVLTDGGAPGVARALSTSPPAVNTWTHLVGVYDAANQSMSLYVNGQLQGTATDTSPWNATGPLLIGAELDAGNRGAYFPGTISDVQIYQNALSASDIATIEAGSTVAPAARWRLLNGSGTTATDTSNNNHPATLAGGYTWTTNPVAGLALDGLSGYAATTGPIVNTAGSFTVSAWVDLTSANGWASVAAQIGTHDSGFYLQYSLSDQKWAFARVLTDGGAPGVARALSTSPPALNTWTHLVAVYNTTGQSMALYVDGQLQGTTTDSSPWNATGPLLIGAEQDAGNRGAYFPGTISDVQIYPDALGASEIAQIDAAATRPITPRSPGPHSLYAYTGDPAGDVSGYQTYQFLTGNDPNTTCASLAACYDNTAISPDNNPALGSVDGINTFSATDLTNAGWNPGSQITLNGATFTLPQYGSGHPDNVLAANQTITYNYTAPNTGASALEFLATSTNPSLSTPGAIKGDNTAPYVPAGTAVTGTYCFDATNPSAYCPATGTINYSDGTTTTYYLTVPDWTLGPEPLAAIQLPHENTPSGQVSRVTMMFPFAVPLKPGKTVTSVTLPDVGTMAGPTSPALHIFGMATRNTTVNTTSTATDATGKNTVTASTLPAGQTWTGTWAAPTEGVFNYGYTFANQTFREAVKPSLAGNTVRVKLDDSLGINPIQIGHATIALAAGGNTPSAATTSTPVNLTFGGNQAVTVPEGGAVYSDPLPFAIPAGQYVLVSFQMTNTVQWLVTHTDTSGTAYQYGTKPNTGDLTTDTTGTTFLANGPGGPSTNVITGLDIQTTGTATQAVLGDGYIDQANTGTRPTATSDLADNLTDAEPTTPNGYGTLAEGIESNQIMTDYPEHNGSGPAALSRIDRDILDQPNLTTVVLNEGLEDTLNGRTAADLDSNGYTDIINYLTAQNVTIIMIGQTPCDGYTGDGTTPNDPCTPQVDQQRILNNTFLTSLANPFPPPGIPAQFYLDPDAAIGAPDTTNGETKLNPAADSGDHTNLNNAGYGALTNTYLAAQDVWPLNDGTGATQVTDAGNNAANPYLTNNPLVGNNTATLTGTTTWPTDPTRGTVLNLDGATGYATTPGPVLTTTGSFTIAAWADLTSTTHNATIISQDATNTSGFALQYDATDNRWALTMPTTDTTNPTQIRALSTAAPTTGTWTHLAGTYNATNHTMSLYINGTLAGTATNTTPINATGTLTIGRGQSATAPTDYFNGNLSNIAAWNYALTPNQITALYQQIN